MPVMSSPALCSPPRAHPASAAQGTDAAALGHALQRLANKWPPAAPPRSAVAQQEQAALCQDVIQLCQALQRRCPTLDAGVISAACHAFAKLCARDRSFQRRCGLDAALKDWVCGGVQGDGYHRGCGHVSSPLKVR